MRQKYNISPTHLPLQPPYSQNSFCRFHEISCIKKKIDLVPNREMEEKTYELFIRHPFDVKDREIGAIIVLEQSFI